MIRFGIIGCGDISKKHFEALKRINSVKLASVCDQNKELAEKAGNSQNVPFYTDPHRMIKNVNLDIISILTPSGNHSKLVLALVKYGKHFIVEKPLALKIKDAEKMVATCKKKGVRLYVVKQNRFNPPIIKLKEAIDQGRFGKLTLGTVRVRWCRYQEYYSKKSWRGTWLQDGGVLTNQASHHIDMLVWLMGPVESVIAKTSTSLAKIETEDTGVVILKFKNGALGIIEATTATRPKDLEGSISILGEGGTVEVSGFFMNELKTWSFTKNKISDKNIFAKHGKTPSVYAWNHTEFLKDVVGCLRGIKNGLVDGEEGKKSIELINAIYQSSETGKEVLLSDKNRKCRIGKRCRKT